MGFNQADGKVMGRAWDLANKWVKNVKCDHALEKWGIGSLGDVINGIHFDGKDQNVWNGRNSQFMVGWGTAETPQVTSVADYFKFNKTSVGAIVNYSQFGPEMFLGYAFFDPTSIGVKQGNEDAARALMLIHEGVHLLGPAYGDAKFGGSKNLTTAIIDSCFPVLKGGLGGLL